jgi:hypothetical protein
MYHFTSLENECRAFGRLKDVGREDLAVKVHGYVALNCTDVIVDKLQAARSKIMDPYAKLDWFLAIDNGVSMGIVKDWVDEVEYDDEDTYDLYQQVAQVSHFSRMLERPHELHKHGIVVRDLSDRQYVNGTLVDLSMASTVPHPFGPGPDPPGLGELWQPAGRSRAWLLGIHIASRNMSSRLGKRAWLSSSRLGLELKI